MKLPNEIVSLLTVKGVNDTIIYLATSALNGEVNLLPSPYTDIYLDEYILIPDLFAQKTKVNINENRYGLVSIVSPETYKGVTIAGPSNIIQWGHPENYKFFDLTAEFVLDRWGKWLNVENILDNKNLAKPSVIAQRGVIVIKAETINFNNQKQ